MDTLVDFFKPVVAQALGPRVAFVYGSLAQINTQLEALPVGMGVLAMNNLLPFTLELPKLAGPQVLGHSVTLMLAVKSHPDWAPDKRNEAQRATLAWLRLLPTALEKAGATVLGSISGSYFINMFDTNLDGVSAGFRLQLPDTWDYCQPVVPPIPQV